MTLKEYRFCEHCLMRTDHVVVEIPDETMRRGKKLYKCTKCGRQSWKRALRPSSEISY